MTEQNWPQQQFPPTRQQGRGRGRDQRGRNDASSYKTSFRDRSPTGTRKNEIILEILVRVVIGQFISLLKWHRSDSNNL